VDNITNLKQILDKVSAEIKHDYGKNIRSLALYGSYAYRDLNQTTSSFEDFQKVVDKKPDFIVIVDDLPTALIHLAKRYDWTRSTFKQILKLNPNTPFAFNVTTHEEYDVEVSEDNFVSTTFPYKLMIISEAGFEDSVLMSDNNIYLASRLSKFFNTLHHRDDECKSSFESGVEEIRDFFVDFTTEQLPYLFNGTDFMTKYLHTTYLAEIYRINDIFGNKHLKIMNDVAFDLQTNELKPMTKVLENILIPYLDSSNEIMLTEDTGNFFTSVYTKADGDDAKLKLLDYLRFNRESFKNTFYKNRITNKSCGSSNIAYVLRKLKNTFK